MSSHYHQELSVNNLLAPPPPPPPLAPYSSSMNQQNDEPFFNYHRNNQNNPRDRSPYHGGDQSFQNHKPRGWQPRPSPPFPMAPQNMYNNANVRGRQPRIPFVSPVAKPTGLRGPWQPDPQIGMELSRKRQRPPDNSYYGGQKDAIRPLLAGPIMPLLAEDTKKEPFFKSGASLSPGNAPALVGNLEEDETANLPAELMVLFGPLKCDLCLIELNSVLQAKMHYSGKNHEKKVGQFMQKWSSEKGEPVPKRYRHGAPKNTTGLKESDLYCEVCDLALTSGQHASQHYQGRNHKRAALGNAPKKAGYLNEALGKWQRLPVIDHDPSGRFHIGQGFVSSSLNSDPLGLQQSLLHEPKPAPVPNLFSCELCHINTTSQDQLETHYKGAKHKKAMANAGDSWSVDRQKIPAPVAPVDSILASLIPKEEARSFVQKSPTTVKRDMSIYRTPSGQYYCQPCNLTLNSEAQFTQHCDTKKHKVSVATVKKPARS